MAVEYKATSSSLLKNDLLDRRSGFQLRSGPDQARKISVLSRLEAPLLRLF